jgi:hypothetical protein
MRLNVKVILARSNSLKIVPANFSASIGACGAI